jgi:hypothetical protein
MEIEKPFVCNLSSKQIKFTKREAQKSLVFLKSNAVYNILAETEKLISSFRGVSQGNTHGENIVGSPGREAMNIKVIRRLMHESVSFKKELGNIISRIEGRWLDENGKGTEQSYSLKV